MIKLKNFVALILSTVLAFNSTVMFASASSGGGGGNFKITADEFCEMSYKKQQIFVHGTDELFNYKISNNIPVNSDNVISYLDIRGNKIFASYNNNGVLEEYGARLSNIVNETGCSPYDIKVDYMIMKQIDDNGNPVIWLLCFYYVMSDTIKFYINSRNDFGLNEPCFYQRCAYVLTPNGMYFANMGQGMTSITVDYKVNKPLSYLDEYELLYYSNNNGVPVYDRDGNYIIPSFQQINFDVQSFPDYGIMSVFADVEKDVTKFDGKYTWVIEDLNNSRLLYVHEDFENYHLNESGKTTITYDKYHYLSYTNPMQSSILLSDLFEGDTPILQFGIDYNLRLAEYSVNSENRPEYHPLEDYTAVISFDSYDDFQVEYPDNVDKDMLGNIIYNYNVYNGNASNVNVNFNSAVDNLDSITSVQWSPSLMNGLTVVRGLFDDILANLGVIEVLLVILTLGVIGFFIGRSVRK